MSITYSRLGGYFQPEGAGTVFFRRLTFVPEFNSDVLNEFLDGVFQGTIETSGDTTATYDRLEFIAEGIPAIGGSVTEMTPRRVTCQNLTTRQRVVIRDGDKSWDCKAAGLGVTSGNRIRMTVDGLAD